MKRYTLPRLTKEQRDSIRFAIRWIDGHKLYGVKHVKGDAWKGIKINETLYS